MADRTGIEWTDATWNPVRGCTRVSPGCVNCYAEGVAARFSGPGQPYEGVSRFVQPPAGGREARWTGELTFGHNLDQPLRWRRPRRIFVNSMSDLFHEGLSVEEIATVYAVAVAAHHLRGHTLQILTKRSARMRAVLADAAFWDQVNAEAGMLVMERVDALDRRSNDARATLDDYDAENPPPGIWLGVSAEDQARADERIPDLLATPAAVRFVSAEPLLGPLDFGRHMDPACPDDPDGLHHVGCGCDQGSEIDWIIVGGESGPNARPMHPDWACSIRDQCAAAGVPFFFKQWGEFAPEGLASEAWHVPPDGPAYPDPLPNGIGKHAWEGHSRAYRVGKRAAGRLLDGVMHNAFPGGSPAHTEARP